jgi:SAM-dependent methyltransferase
MAVLHHLDLEMAHREIYRILRPGGRLILREPIRFSRIANSLRDLLPAPAVDISDFEHPMTRDELATVTRGFTVLADRSFRLPFVPFLARSAVFEKQVWKLDHWLLQHFPKLKHFATGKVMSLERTAPPAAT